MGSLADFLVDNPVDNLTEDITISTRLKKYPFKIRVVSNREYDDYVRQCRQYGKKGKVVFDSSKFSLLIVLNHTVEPNFRDAAMIKKAGCKTPEEFVSRSLLPGEIADLTKAISQLSGFDQDMDFLVEEVKN